MASERLTGPMVICEARNGHTEGMVGLRGMTCHWGQDEAGLESGEFSNLCCDQPNVLWFVCLVHPKQCAWGWKAARVTKIDEKCRAKESVQRFHARLGCEQHFGNEFGIQNICQPPAGCVQTIWKLGFRKGWNRLQLMKSFCVASCLHHEPT